MQGLAAVFPKQVSERQPVGPVLVRSVCLSGDAVLLTFPFLPQMGGGRGKPLCRQLLTSENRWLGPWSSARAKGSGRGAGGKNLEPAACNKMVCAGRLDADSTGLLVFTQVRNASKYNNWALAAGSCRTTLGRAWSRRCTCSLCAWTYCGEGEAGSELRRKRRGSS